MTMMTHKPLANLDVPRAEGTSGPPEPPTRPLAGQVWELKGEKFWCRVPGCSKPDRPFEKRHAIAVHIARRHGITMEGKAIIKVGGSRAPASRDPEAELRYVDVRDVLTGNNLNLVMQAIRILETTRENLTGKLTEMELLAKKSAKLAHIIGKLRELVPAASPPSPPAP